MNTDAKELQTGGNRTLITGVLLVLLGIGAIAFPNFSTLTAEIWIGWLLVFSGVTKLVYAFQSRAEGGFIWKLLLSLLYIATGGLLIAYPLQGVLTLTLALASFLLVEGIFEIVLALQLRPQANWSWLLGNGIITLVLGGMIWREWPFDAPWTLGLLVGISIISSGVARIMLALANRSTVDTPA